ncbi:unnamed protein product, partial [marine sediment metagenome]
MKGYQSPLKQEEVIFRSREQLTLFDGLNLRDDVPKFSKMVTCAPFQRFG